MTTADHTAPTSPPGSGRAACTWSAVRGLTKTYGQAPPRSHAVRDVDLDVHAGEVLLVWDPAGSARPPCC